MKQNNKTVNILILILTSIPSLTLFWNIVSIFQEVQPWYTIFQFLSTASFTYFSILFTDDHKFVLETFNKYPILRKKLEKLENVSIHIFVFIKYFFVSIPIIFSSEERIEEIKAIKKDARSEVVTINEYSSTTKFFFVIATPSLIMMVLCFFIPQVYLSWIQEILNTIVSVVGLYFVIKNLK